MLLRAEAFRRNVRRDAGGRPALVDHAGSRHGAVGAAILPQQFLHRPLMLASSNTCPSTTVTTRAPSLTSVDSSPMASKTSDQNSLSKLSTKRNDPRSMSAARHVAAFEDRHAQVLEDHSCESRSCSAAYSLL